ncbi:3-keto-5-aminohexanoate cleavage protein [Chelatococcus reniformis]|uniref:3-keto-5-aminohexanoate cleavage protein n=1 Tax=Chelatococcus reniformis TaxID=1494448 RepID=A0A916U0B7_9HYPH|nr:3-keto-5-aminohexanoate cleavage protein [Chelatococcus reniformis]GGC55499.1 3-keto-5-aminohexanoate cleavage protein [Chelatococcus reniformis]
MSQPVWLEVALNGPWGRGLQPLAPVSVDAIVGEAVACVQAGAAIVHLHAYDAEGRQQVDCADTYARIIEAIRERAGAIVYPTIASGDDRYAIIEQLAARGLLEWAVVDPGSVNIEPLHPGEAGLPSFTYVNTPANLERGFDLAARHGFHPAFACYEPGFVRAGAAYCRRQPAVPRPVYRLMFSSTFSFGFPPGPQGLRAYKALLDEVAPGEPFMVSGLGVDVRPLARDAVALGGHVRVGLEDAPLGSPHTNLELVEEMAGLIRDAGRQLATADEVRRQLAARLPREVVR